MPGVVDPVVVVLALIAFFSAISGKPLDGLLIFVVAAGLAVDARLHRGLARPAPTDDEPGWPQPGWLPRRIRPDTRPASRLVLTAAGLAGGALYAVVAGAFARFSWPATIAVAGLGALVILIGWQGPVRDRVVPGRLPLLGTALWGGLLVAGGLVELWALLHQSSLGQTSYAHPTLSALADPVLASGPGRALVLGGWLLLGWYLVRR